MVLGLEQVHRVVAVQVREHRPTLTPLERAGWKVRVCAMSVDPALEADPTEGTGLCLSGGGYRAMLFHVGTLWRLNEAGLLRGLDRISSVSGGSITAGVLGLYWDKLSFDASNVASNLGDVLVEPIRDFASHTVDESAIAVGLLTPESIGERVSKAYRDRLFGDATLQGLPGPGQGPR